MMVVFQCCLVILMRRVTVRMRKDKGKACCYVCEFYVPEKQWRKLRRNTRFDVEVHKVNMV